MTLSVRSKLVFFLMVNLTKRERTDILCMIGYCDRMRIQREVLELNFCLNTLLIRKSYILSIEVIREAAIEKGDLLCYLAGTFPH